jgi:hypothetical protein
MHEQTQRIYASSRPVIRQYYSIHFHTHGAHPAQLAGLYLAPGGEIISTRPGIRMISLSVHVEDHRENVPGGAQMTTPPGADCTAGQAQPPPRLSRGAASRRL